MANWTAGVMLALTTTFLKYAPLDVWGLSLRTVDSIALMLSLSFWLSKLSLPTTQWTLPPESLRNSILPAAYSRTASAMLAVTVPALGEGMRPLGPRTLPRRPTKRIMSGVAMATSKSEKFSRSISWTRDWPPALMAPA